MQVCKLGGAPKSSALSLETPAPQATGGNAASILHILTGSAERLESILPLWESRAYKDHTEIMYKTF